MSKSNPISSRLLLIFILMAMLLGNASPACAHIFRSATLSWKILDPAHPNVVTFRLQAAICWSYPALRYRVGTQEYYGPYPPIGALLDLTYVFSFRPSVSSYYTPPEFLTAQVIGIDAAHDFFIVEQVFAYTYPEASATYTPILYGSARGNLLNGNSELSYSLQAQIAIDMNSPHDSPVVTMPEVISVPRSRVTSFLMGAFAPRGGELTYSIPPVSETYLHAAVPYRGAASNPIPIMSLDPQTGLITWDTQGELGAEVALGKYGVQLRVADAWGNYTFREFVVEVVAEGNGTPPGIAINGSGAPPTFSARYGSPPTPVTFEMRGSDADFDYPSGSPQRVGFLDAGSHGSVPLVLSAWGTSPVTRTVQWTPPSRGTFTLPYWIVDSTYMVSTMPVTINVTDAPKITCSPAGSLNLEATDHNGAVPEMSATITDHDSASVTITWLVDDTVAHTDSVSLAAGTGSTLASLPIGFGWHVIKGHVSDEVGEASAGCVVSVHVQDTTPPVIPYLPPLFGQSYELVAEATTLTGGVVNYVVPDATDAVDGAVPLVCTPASGAFFPVNQHTSVRCTATDHAGNRATTSQRPGGLTYPAGFPVYVYDAPPVMPLLFPPNRMLVVEATGPSGAYVHYDVPPAQDRVDGAIPLSCALPPSTSILVPLGLATKVCEATDRAGNVGAVVFFIEVRDTTLPVIPAVSNMTVEATSAGGAVVTYTTPKATDVVDGAVTLVCTPASGSRFTLGTNTVQCSATDHAGNIARTSFTLTVRDTIPPVIPALANLTLEATSSSGTVANFALPDAIDSADGAVALVCIPASGSNFAIGNTSVSCSATDHAGNNAGANFTVTVRDTTPPVIPALANMTTEATSGSGAVVTFSVSNATDTVDGERPATCTPASGNTFALGTSTVSCTATDRAGNIGRASFTITVRDTTPPVVGPVIPSQQVLWPPNHQMVPVSLNYSVADNTGATCTLSATSNEPDNGLGDGDLPGDVHVVSPTVVELRAERAGAGEGRLYAVSVRCADAYGNAGTATTSVVVPKNMGGGRK